MALAEKSVFTIILLFCFSSHALEKKDPVAEIAEAMANAYIQSASKEVAMKTIENLATQAIGTDMSGKLGTALGIYSLYENGRAYGESSRESQKYQAVAHGTATLVGMIAPPAGVVAQIIVFCQDLAAEYVFNSYKVDFAKLEMETAALEKQRSDLLLKEWRSETAVFNLYLARYQSSVVLITEQQPKITALCDAGRWLLPSDLQSCFQELIVMSRFLFLQEETLRLIFSFEGRFVKIENMILKGSIKLTSQQSREALHELRLRNSAIKNQITHIGRLLSEAKVARIESDAEKAGEKRGCETQMLKTSMQIAIMKAELRKQSSPSQNSNERLALAQGRLQQLRDFGCADLAY